MTSSSVLTNCFNGFWSSSPPPQKCGKLCEKRRKSRKHRTYRILGKFKLCGKIYLRRGFPSLQHFLRGFSDFLHFPEVFWVFHIFCWLTGLMTIRVCQKNFSENFPAISQIIIPFGVIITGKQIGCSKLVEG